GRVLATRARKSSARYANHKRLRTPTRMERRLILSGILLLIACPAFSQRKELHGYDAAKPPLANSESEKRILETLDGIVKAHQTYLNVPMLDGRALRVLTEAVGAKSVIEIGTSTGYSGLWFCLALERTG